MRAGGIVWRFRIFGLEMGERATLPKKQSMEGRCPGAVWAQMHRLAASDVWKAGITFHPAWFIGGTYTPAPRNPPSGATRNSLKVRIILGQIGWSRRQVGCFWV